jgi:anti-sigma B factor antagonist
VNFRMHDEELDEQTHVVALGGEIDLYTAPQFRERMAELIDAGKKQIVVDLSAATFIDSTALGVIVGSGKRLRPGRGAITVVCPDENIAKIFQLTGLHRVFSMHATREEAVGALGPAAE